jgi:glycosyltransferase involved in cell wall biosynthesis
MSNHLLFVIDDLGSGGAQQQMLILARGFRKEGIAVSCLTYHRNDFYLEALLSLGVEVTTEVLDNPLKRILFIRQFIRKGGFSTVIAFLGIPVFVAELAGIPNRKWKLLVGERSNNPLIRKSLKSRFIRIFHLFSDFVVSNSFANQQMVQSITPFISQKKYRVIYNGINLDKYCPLPSYRFAEKGRFRMVVPASYRKLKNVLGLIEAVNLLTNEEKQQLTIDWYGDRTPFLHLDYILDEAEVLVSRYRLEEIVKLNDAVNNIQHVIQQADAVGLFSFFEGLPNAVCEGMACGKPVLASDVSDVPRLIEDGVNGVLCKAEDVDSILRGLRYLMHASSDELEAMGRNGRAKAELLFDQEKIVQQYLDLIKN